MSNKVVNALEKHIKQSLREQTARDLARQLLTSSVFECKASELMIIFSNDKDMGYACTENLKIESVISMCLSLLKGSVTHLSNNDKNKILNEINKILGIKK